LVNTKLEKMKKALIALDLSIHDKPVIAGSKRILFDKLGYKDLTFINIVNDLVHPNHDTHQLLAVSQLDKNLLQKVKEAMTDDIKNTFKELTKHIKVEVREGKAYKKLIHWIEVENVDMVVVGVKDRSSHSGITAKRLAHNINRDMLFITSNPDKKVKNILVPIDFSGQCLKALQTAFELKRKDSEVKITVLNAINAAQHGPYISAYFYKYLDIIYENTQIAVLNFLKKAKIDPKEICISIVKGVELSIAKSISEFASINNTDLIIMGAKSHNKFRNILLGSVTESLIDFQPEQDLMIIR